MKTLFPILFAITLAACAHKPVIYHAPDSAKMDASGERLHQAVTAAATSHKQVQNKVAEVKAKVIDQKQHIDVLSTKLDNLFRIAPAELRDEIDAARVEQKAIADDNAGLALKVESVVAMQSFEGKKLEEANAADKDHAADREQYKSDSAKLAQYATDWSLRAAKWEKESDRRGNFIGWFAAVCVFSLTMRFTGLIPGPYGWAIPLGAATAAYFLARLIV